MPLAKSARSNTIKKPKAAHEEELPVEKDHIADPLPDPKAAKKGFDFIDADELAPIVPEKLDDDAEATEEGLAAEDTEEEGLDEEEINPFGDKWEQ